MALWRVAHPVARKNVRLRQAVLDAFREWMIPLRQVTGKFIGFRVAVAVEFRGAALSPICGLRAAGEEPLDSAAMGAVLPGVFGLAPANSRRSTLTNRCGVSSQGGEQQRSPKPVRAPVCRRICAAGRPRIILKARPAHDRGIQRQCVRHRPWL